MSSTLLNPRAELFCQHTAAGKTAAEAYTLAGYKPNPHNAARLKQKEAIRCRIAELQSRNLQIQDEAVQISSERLAAQLARAFAIAEAAKRPSDMVTATIAQAKLAGKWTERSENTQSNEFAGMSSSDMRRELIRRARELGLDREIAGLEPKNEDENETLQ
jgi:hypothetical protein